MIRIIDVTIVFSGWMVTLTINEMGKIPLKNNVRDCHSKTECFLVSICKITPFEYTGSKLYRCPNYHFLHFYKWSIQQLTKLEKACIKIFLDFSKHELQNRMSQVGFNDSRSTHGHVL